MKHVDESARKAGGASAPKIIGTPDSQSQDLKRYRATPLIPTAIMHAISAFRLLKM